MFEPAYVIHAALATMLDSPERTCDGAAAAVVLTAVALIPALALPRRPRPRRGSARGDSHPITGNSNLGILEASTSVGNGADPS